MNTSRNIQEYCDAYRAAWVRGGTRLTLEAALIEARSIDAKELFPRLLEVEIEVRCAAGQQPSVGEYLDRFPSHRAQIIAVFTDIGTQRDVRPGVNGAGALSMQQTLDDLPERSELMEPPSMIGRYRIRQRLGEGGFGIVYLAKDEKLERLVAIKTPRRASIISAGEVKSYLDEARAVARLDHPHIVPVYDVGSSEEYPCYVVSKYIDGSNLAARIKRERLSLRETVSLVQTVAEALHYSHKQGLVHRDIKPGNILLDSQNKPYVADYGLALRDQDIGKVASHAGTPMYMSPEQARGEGHRVDGRSDIFSLGVVLYELLTGRRPFRSESASELREQITTEEAKPPRQIDDNIPRELERICLKAMSKRTTDRYTTARDFADDLRVFLEGMEHTALPNLSEMTGQQDVTGVAPVQPSSAATTGLSQGAGIKVVPKGLRSFDARDADFFLDLLPGPRDREGMPEAIRYWKTRIEETDGDQTFMVGLIYGPSGCGKSSLVKAGLLPRLSSDIITVFVESTAQETESRLLHGLRKRCPALEEKWGLRESIAALRKGYGVPAGKKVLIVLDQFEQWLHGRKDEVNTKLMQALRHCDGARVQCVVLVRDDFWLAVSRFMRQLEVELVPGKNIQLVDLFDGDHARKVLVAFGKAFWKLPEELSQMTREQKEFIRQSVEELSQEHRVICVRLALFAEMMKNRPWTPATLREVGGSSGLGMTFLEETFSSAQANPAHREHQKAVRAVLQSLLPEPGRAIKGNMRSQEELLKASGYEQKPREFAKLLRILDSDLRLITPTDPEGNDVEVETTARTPGQTYYQLTHDYLVHSLREWLTWKQKATRTGRAELCLAERTAQWMANREDRHLPSLTEYVRIRLLTDRSQRTETQREMMRRADRYYLLHTGMLLAALLAIGWGTWEFTGQQRAQSIHDQLLSADVREVPGILREMEPYRRQVDPLLRATLLKETDGKRKLVLSLALVGSDASQLPYLTERLLEAAPGDFGVIRDGLAGYSNTLSGKLWKELANLEQRKEVRIRAACALAQYDHASVKGWESNAVFVVEHLLGENPLHLSYWMQALLPVRAQILPVLQGRILNAKNNNELRSLVGFYQYFGRTEPSAMTALESHMLPEGSPAPEITKAIQQANMGTALFALGRPEKIWPLLQHQPDPTVRSLLIERLSQAELDAVALLRRYREEKDTGIKKSILQVLGGMPKPATATLHLQLLEFYSSEADGGVHSCLRWVLNAWGHQGQVERIDKQYQSGDATGKRSWRVNSIGQTLNLIDGPVTLLEAPGTAQANHRYAMGITEVTVGQYKQYLDERKLSSHYSQTLSKHIDSPINTISWHEAAGFCNWLSEKDKIPANEYCYEARDQKMEIVPGYQGKRGYRLPTEAEWEYAYRSGTSTSCSFGLPNAELANSYACWAGNCRATGEKQFHRVGRLKPNDFGLFDMHGNVAEWCQENKRPSPQRFQDVLGVTRGSTYSFDFSQLGHEVRTATVRSMILEQNGFRIVRTMP